MNAKRAQKIPNLFSKENQKWERQSLMDRRGKEKRKKRKPLKHEK